MTEFIPTVKILVIGDENVGKTALASTFIDGPLRSDVYEPTIFATYSASMTTGNQPVTGSIWEGGGATEHDAARFLLYPDTDVIIIVFSIISRASFGSVITRWIPEMKKYCPNVPFLLVGTQLDFLSNEGFLMWLKLKQLGVDSTVRLSEGKTVAKQFGALNYYETSALTGQGVRGVFQEAVDGWNEARKQRRRARGQAQSNPEDELLDDYQNGKSGTKKEKANKERNLSQSKSTQATPKPAPQATPQATPQAVPQATPQATPQTVPPPVPQATPQATAPQATAPQATPQATAPAPQATAPQATAPQATPQATAPAPQATAPQATPQATPQTTPQVTSAAQATPQATVSSTPQPKPQTETKMLPAGNIHGTSNFQHKKPVPRRSSEDTRTSSSQKSQDKKDCSVM